MRWQVVEWQTRATATTLSISLLWLLLSLWLLCLHFHHQCLITSAPSDNPTRLVLSSVKVVSQVAGRIVELNHRKCNNQLLLHLAWVDAMWCHELTLALDTDSPSDLPARSTVGWSASAIQVFFSLMRRREKLGHRPACLPLFNYDRPEQIELSQFRFDKVVDIFMVNFMGFLPNFFLVIFLKLCFWLIALLIYF